MEELIHKGMFEYHVAQYLKEYDVKDGRVKEHSFPEAIMSLDPGDKNLGICIMRLNPQWASRRNQLLVESKKTHPVIVDLEMKHDEHIQLDRDIPVYDIAQWCVVSISSEQQEPVASVAPEDGDTGGRKGSKSGKGNNFGASETIPTTRNGTPLNRSQLKRKKKTVTVFLPDSEICKRLASAITSMIIKFNVRVVLLEKQLSEAKRNCVIENAIACIVIANEAYTGVKLVQMRALQKFDLHSKGLVSLFRKYERESSSIKSKPLKFISKQIVTEVISTAVAHVNAEKEAFEATRLVVVEGEDNREAEAETGSQNVSDANTTTNSVTFFTNANGPLFRNLGLVFINPKSIAQYDVQFSNVNKKDDVADVFMQVMSFIPSIICSTLAQNRAANIINHTIDKNAQDIAAKYNIPLPPEMFGQSSSSSFVSSTIDKPRTERKGDLESFQKDRLSGFHATRIADNGDDEGESGGVAETPQCKNLNPFLHVSSPASLKLPLPPVPYLSPILSASGSMAVGEDKVTSPQNPRKLTCEYGESSDQRHQEPWDVIDLDLKDSPNQVLLDRYFDSDGPNIHPFVTSNTETHTKLEGEVIEEAVEPKNKDGWL